MLVYTATTTFYQCSVHSVSHLLGTLKNCKDLIKKKKKHACKQNRKVIPHSLKLINNPSE